MCMWKTRRVSSPLLPVVLGVLVAIVVVLAAYGWVPRVSTDTVTLDGVHLTITYLGRSVEVYGPTHQDACLQVVAVPWPTNPNPDCPTNLTGGSEYSFLMFELTTPTNVSEVVDNMTLYSPVPFFQYDCGSEFHPPASSASSLGPVGLPSGDPCGWYVTIEVPNPAPVIPGGFWMTANLTAFVV